MSKSNHAPTGTNGKIHPTAAPDYSSPASTAGYEMEYDSDDLEGGIPSSAFAFPTFQISGASAQSSGGGGFNSSNIAASNIRKVLGPTFRLENPKDYRALLNRHFTLKNVEGHIEAEWKPSGFSGASSPADLTGAMAIFYTYADSTVTQLKNQIARMERMSSIDPDKPAVCCEDIRTVLSDKLNALIGALGAKDGVCVERVDATFEGARDLLELFRREYIGQDSKRKRSGIFCPEDARRLALFRLLEGGLTTLRDRWDDFAGEFLLGTGGPSVAVALQKGQRRLQVIMAAIKDISSGLSCAGWKKPARSLAQLEADGPSVGAFLDWTREFSSRASGALRVAGPAGLGILALEAKQLKGHAAQLRTWVNKTVLSGLPCQVSDLAQTVHDAKEKDAQAELTRTTTESAEMQEKIKKCEADLAEVAESEARDLEKIKKEYASEIRKPGCDKKRIESKYRDRQKAHESEYQKKRAYLEQSREEIARDEQKVAEKRAAAEYQLSKIAQTAAPIAQTAFTGFHWMVLGIPGAVDILNTQLADFAAGMQGLVDNCDPSVPGGPRNYSRYPRGEATVPAGGPEGGEDDVAQQSGTYYPEQSDEDHCAS